MTIKELPPNVRISFRLADPTAAATVGLMLPTRIGARSVAGGRDLLRLGPDEWAIEVPEGDGDALKSKLAELATRAPLSAVEVSDRDITFGLSGSSVLDLLATGCPLDLARMPVGSGTRTVFDTVQVILTRDADDRFRLVVWRSFAPHVRALLAAAANELAAGL
ncbi:sarcosine oxidase subunit gamma [Methylobacterium sp. P31]